MITCASGFVNIDGVNWFLNQVHAWYLGIAFVQEVGMHVCLFVCVCVNPKTVCEIKPE